MAFEDGCRCGHAAREHFMRGGLARAGACKQVTCMCQVFGPAQASTPAAPRDPLARRPVTPPRNPVT